MLLVVPMTLAVAGAFALGAYGVFNLKLYGFVLLLGALATVRSVFALAQAAWRGRSPAWFEEQDLDEDEVRDLRRKFD